MRPLSRTDLEALLLCALLCCLGECVRIPRDGVDPATMQEEVLVEPPAPQSEERSYQGCRGSSQGCQKERQEAELDEDQLRRVRIEVIKQRILQKLRLKAPPQVRVQRRGLPSVLLSNSDALLHADSLDSGSGVVALRNSRENAPPPVEDNFYGTTKNVFLFPDGNIGSQVQCSQRSSVCLSFHLSPEVIQGSLSSSHVWLYKQSTNSHVNGTPAVSNQTLVVSEIVYDRQFGILRKRILALEDEEYGRSSGGWLRFRVDRAVRRWVTKPHLVHALEISCKGCGRSPVPVSQSEGNQPFLVLAVGAPATLNRRRRELVCTNTTSVCCKESFYLNFQEIGWDEWILQPVGYTANYCRGSCLTDISTSRYYHTTVLSRFLQNQIVQNKEPRFSLCCTPANMSSISLIYVDEDGDIYQKSLSNMVVESCDCA